MEQNVICRISSAECGEEEYPSQFAIESGQGAPALPFRTSVGALIKKKNSELPMKKPSNNFGRITICSISSKYRGSGMKHRLIHPLLVTRYARCSAVHPG
jgi:hypothetical protein